ncbi:ribosomal protection-like ABC-F family protein [Agrilactobacillus yilanensis]|uniref:Ribosomal protection-like ABC-F family protein n=1 Tax=Agrilactobacillus yilanensis TaxID=2485997 RepID=A0ABW4J8A7_9LACO|nr:ABC-F family ATP-binding cassette domain-containing protein [Agrilactobacillus yilanensis]
MQYYQIKHVTQTFGPRTLFTIKQLGFHSGDRIGLIGANGTGKTTLLRLLGAADSPITPSASKYVLPQIKPSAQLSGGEIVKRYLDEAFASQADILFLDEPTANLDVENIKTLENRLRHYPGTLIIISHDRAFLDKIATTIWALADQKISVCKGNYTDYQAQKDQMLRKQQQEYQAYEKQKNKLEKAAEKRQIKAKRAATIPRNKVNTQEAYKAKPHYNKIAAKLAKTAKSIEKRATQLDVVAKPQKAQDIKMTLNNGTALRQGKVLNIENFDLYQGQQLLIKQINFGLKGGEKVALTGPNGSGKTTLIEAILKQQAPEIFLNEAVEIGYFKQDLHNLDLKKTVYENVNAASYQTESLNRTILARLGFKDEALAKPVGVLSGGERVKISFAKIFVSKANFLILDEPTNFLDIVALEALQALLAAYPGTVLLVSHDRYFVSKVATRRLIFDPKQHVLQDPTKANLPSKKAVVATESVDQAAILLQLKNRQATLLNALTAEPDNTDYEQEFLEISRKIRQLS